MQFEMQMRAGAAPGGADKSDHLAGGNLSALFHGLGKGVQVRIARFDPAAVIQINHVAIPATIAYNKFSTDLARFANRMEDFASVFSSLLNRELEAKV